MNKKYFLVSIILFILWMLGSFLIHEVLLATGYEGISQLYRTDADMQSHIMWMTLAHILLAFAFTWIYLRGQDKKPWLGQGLRFGIAIVVLNVAPVFLIYYTLQPLPGILVAKQIIFEGGLVVLLALILAFIYRNEQNN